MTVADSKTSVTSSASTPVIEAALEPKAGRGWLVFGIHWGIALASLLVMFLPVPPSVIGLMAIVMMIVFLFVGMPAAFAMIIPSAVGMYAMRGWRVVEGSFATVAYDEIANWTLSVLPMFVVMGLLLWRSGITGNIYLAASRWLSWLPGGLAVGTTMAGTGLASVSGSSTGVVYALARVGVPEMLKAGYSKRLAVGSIIVSSMPGQLIPPSILLVLYAGIAEVPVGQQLLAGIGPGVFVGFAFCLMIVVMVMTRPSLVGENTKIETSWRERWTVLLKSWPIPLLGIFIMVGMFSGLMTATEVGAVAALAAVVLTVAYTWKSRSSYQAVKESALGTVSTVGAVFLLLVAVEVLSRMMTLTGLSTQLSDYVTDLGLNRVAFLLVMVVVYLFLGAFMEALPMMVLTVPVLMPTLETLDISMLWFGVFVVFMGEIAVISPPVGILGLMIYNIVKDPKVNLGTKFSITDVYMASLWFLPMALVICVVLILFPQLALWIPEISRG